MVTTYYSVLSPLREAHAPKRPMRRSPVAKGKCFYCGCMMYTRGTAGALANPDQIASNDHYVPHAITSTSGLPEGKFVVCCVRCNNIKANFPADVFQYFVRQTNMRRPTSAVRADFARFIYLLISTGFIVSMRGAKQPFTPRVASVRDSRGRFTKRQETKPVENLKSSIAV